MLKYTCTQAENFFSVNICLLSGADSATYL